MSPSRLQAVYTQSPPSRHRRRKAPRVAPRSSSTESSKAAARLARCRATTRSGPPSAILRSASGETIPHTPHVGVAGGGLPDHDAPSPDDSTAAGHGLVPDSLPGSGEHLPDLGIAEAATLHRLLRTLHAVGNEVRLRFLQALRTFYDGNVCLELGYSCFQQYCDRELGLARSTSLEYVRVARALDGLPRLRALFGQGELSWEQVRAVSRVASSDTEVAWIELAFSQPVPVLMAEVREAQRTGRDGPRDRSYGLPNLLVRLILQLTIEEKERVRAAFEIVGLGAGLDASGAAGHAAECDGPGGGDAGDPRPPLVRWADGILSGAIPARPARREGGVGAGTAGGQRLPAQTIVYHTCPACRETTLSTDEGPLRVAPERVDELAAVANRVVIDHDDAAATEPRRGNVPAGDRPESHQDEAVVSTEAADIMPSGMVDAPNSARLTRQVLHRDGLRCANPGCGRRHHLQAHHVVFRSHGGRSVLSNEIALCDVCHALVHAGLLEVTGAADGRLEWRRRPVSGEATVRDAAALRAMLDTLEAELAASVTSLDGAGGPPDPGARAAPFVPPGTWTVLPPTGERRPPTSMDAAGRSPRACANQMVGDLAEALNRLGFARSESEGRVRWAIAAMLAEQAEQAGQAEKAGRAGREQRTRSVEALDEADVLMKALSGS